MFAKHGSLRNRKSRTRREGAVCVPEPRTLMHQATCLQPLANTESEFHDDATARKPNTYLRNLFATLNVATLGRASRVFFRETSPKELEPLHRNTTLGKQATSMARFNGAAIGMCAPRMCICCNIIRVVTGSTLPFISFVLCSARGLGSNEFRRRDWNTVELPSPTRTLFYLVQRRQILGLLGASSHHARVCVSRICGCKLRQHRRCINNR